MQLMPETAAMLGVSVTPSTRGRTFTAVQAHLRAMMERFRHDVRLAITA